MKCKVEVRVMIDDEADDIQVTLGHLIRNESDVFPSEAAAAAVIEKVRKSGFLETDLVNTDSCSAVWLIIPIPDTPAKPARGGESK